MLAFLERIGTAELLVMGGILGFFILRYGMRPLGRFVGNSTGAYAASAPKPTEPASPVQYAEAPKNAAATTGLILGILSIFMNFIGLIPLVGIVFSVVGLYLSGSRGGTGRRHALAGLVLCVLFMLVNMQANGHIH